ncbi:hypothetical protein ATANTOWER_032449 [Ataeniobius toweri]|uniref:Uncharacterized protein n=1 Tax=Ataeniobius toweri TaxID=208326 RepID=A0ABU7ASY0_9TELE|nr:hypothetical protein [Ataeniobius toweri]
MALPTEEGYCITVAVTGALLASISIGCSAGAASIKNAFAFLDRLPQVYRWKPQEKPVVPMQVVHRLPLQTQSLI